MALPRCGYSQPPCHQLPNLFCPGLWTIRPQTPHNRVCSSLGVLLCFGPHWLFLFLKNGSVVLLVHKASGRANDLT
jgi:hypothetical protein